MTVVIGFTIILMLLFAGYMSYRLFLKRTLSVLICLGLEVFALTVALIAFVFDVQTNNFAETLYVAFGVLVPAGFFAYDYVNMIKKIRNQGGNEDFFKAVKKMGNSRSKIPKAVKGRKITEEPVDGDIFSQLERLGPSDYEGYYELGLSYYQMGLTEKAIEAFKRVVEIKPDTFKAYYSMAIALDETGEADEAARAFKKAININPEYTEAYNNLGILLSSQGKYDEALYVYSKGLERMPAEYSFYFNMGVVLSETGRFSDAVKAYEKALERKPDEYDINYHLGAALTQTGRYDEAIEAYKSALKKKPSDSELFYNLSIVYSLLRKHDIAIDNLKKAIEINKGLKADAKKNKAFDSMKTKMEFKELVS